MKKIVNYLFLILSINSFSQNITQTEIVGRPTNNSITIQAFFDADVEVSIQYGTITGNYTYNTPWQNFMANEPAEVVLSGLLADTKYYYK
jgi:hypothetical protein